MTTGVFGMERVPVEVQLFRADVLESFIANGVPVADIDHLRALPER